jgi:hypothetical protein
MLRWAVKDGNEYLDIDGNFSRSFSGIRLFGTKKSVLKDIKDKGDGPSEKAVKIEIKEIK